MKKKICYVKKLPLNRVYRFNPVGDREGRPSVFHNLYQDEQDFTINSVLMNQIKFEDCHETTPEGKAVWLYVRLCQLLCYDEKYFFAQTCHKPNDDIHESFKIVGNVTAETPVTCFNFSRIAVKLLNQIFGVHAVMISVGENLGHLRFGFYTKNITVDAEPTTTIHHFTDMARVKFGMEPRGLNFIYGSRFEDALRHDVIMPMLIGRQENFREYLKWIRALPPDPQPNQLRFEDLIADLKNNHLDGNSVVQITSNIKHHFQEQAREKKYQWLRAGIVQDNDVVPQLLLRRDQKLTRVDLEHLEIFDLPVAEYFNSLANGKMVIADETEDDIKKNTRFKFSWGLETAKAPIVEK